MIGTLTTWSSVPNGALARAERSGAWYVRIGNRGWCVYAPSEEPAVWCAYAHYPSGAREDEGWPWGRGGADTLPEMRIAALGLTGDETADWLADLATAFECAIPWTEAP